MTAKRTASLVFLIIAILGSIGYVLTMKEQLRCRDNVRPGKEVICLNSDEGRATVDILAIQPDAALALAMEHQNSLTDDEKSSRPFCNTLALIVDNQYVVAHRNKTLLLLTGYYVDGQSGDVKYVETDEFVCPRSGSQ